MREIIGSGGGAEVPKAPSVDKVNLQSNAIAKVLVVYSEGETEGLVDGAKSIYLDETPLQGPDGSFNFEGVEWEERVGLPTQEGIGGFENSSTVRSIDTEVVKSTPVVRAVSNINVDYARVVITSPRLGWLQDDGDQRKTSVELAFAVMDPVTGIWEQAGTKTIEGRTQAQYQVAVKVNKPSTVSTQPWQIRVTRVTDDAADPDKLYNRTYWSSVVEIQEGQETYPDTAYVGMTFDTSLFGSRVPKVAFEVKGIRIKVPSNYNQTDWNAPSYEGIWDGTWKYEATPNPIWQILDLITHPRYGLNIPEAQVNRYTFYEMARYCDAVDPTTGAFVGVPDVEAGVKRRRFTCNTQIMKKDSALEILNAIASAARAAIYYGGGSIIPIQDSPKSASWRFTNANVKDGRFMVQWLPLSDLMTIRNTRFNNPSDFYRVDVESYPAPENQDSDPTITSRGRIEHDVFKYGCTNRAEAAADAKWGVITSQTENKKIVFTTGLEGASVSLGEVVEVFDTAVAGVRVGGKIIGGDVSTVEIDSAIKIEAGKTYTISIVKPSGTGYETRTVINEPGEAITELHVDPSFTHPPTEYFGWFLEIEGEIEPTQWRVISKKEVAAGEYEIVGLFYNAAKFDEVETGLVFTEPSYTKPDLKSVLPPTNLQWAKRSRLDQKTGVSTEYLVAYWTPSESTTTVGYQVLYQHDGGGVVDMGRVITPEVEIPSILEGTHLVTVYAMNIKGVRSPALVGTYEYTLTGVSALSAPTGLQVRGGGTTFTGPDLNLEWTPPLESVVDGDVLKGYQIEMWSELGGTLKRREIVTTPSYQYDGVKNRADGIDRSLYVKVWSLDSTHQVSENPVTGTFTNPAPVAPAFSVQPGVGQVFVTIEPSTATDIAGYAVCMGDSSDFTPSEGSLVYTGPDTSSVIQTPSTGTKFFKVASWDSFDSAFANLIWSPSSSAIITDPGERVDVVFYGLTFKGNDPSTNQVSWTAATALYTIAGSTSTYSITGSDATWTEGVLYLYWDKNSSPTTILTTTDPQVAAGRDKRLLAVYRGGTDLANSSGKVFIDGGNLYAGTVTAGSIATGVAVITETAQIASAIIDGANIKTATIDGANLKNATITSAQIGNLEVKEAHIDSLSVGTDKIKIDGVSKTTSATTSGIVYCPNTAFTGIQSFVHSTNGSTKALVQFSFDIDTGADMKFGNSRIDIQFKEGSTVLKSYAMVMPASIPWLYYNSGAAPGANYVVYIGYGGHVEGTLLVDLSSGNNTYTLEVKPYKNTPPGTDFSRQVTNRLLALTEIKR